MPRTPAKAAAPKVAPAADELTPLEMFALSKAVAPAALKALRPRLETADAQPVDFRLRIRGSVNVASNATATEREKARVDRLLACLLSHVKPRARKPLLDLVRADFEEFRRGGELPDPGDELVDLADDLVVAASRDVNKTKAGAVGAALEVKLIKRA